MLVQIVHKLIALQIHSIHFLILIITFAIFPVVFSLYRKVPMLLNFLVIARYRVNKLAKGVLKQISFCTKVTSKQKLTYKRNTGGLSPHPIPPPPPLLSENFLINLRLSSNAINYFICFVFMYFLFVFNVFCLATSI